jgi:hypothetical protein
MEESRKMAMTSFLRFQGSSPSCRLSELEAGLVISRSYERVKPPPSAVLPPLRVGSQGVPHSVTPLK